MKTKNFRKGLAILGIGGMAILGLNATAQDSSTTTVTTASVPAPKLSYGVPQVLQLAQAKVSEETMIAFVKNSGNGYSLKADEIIYLRQQGVSDAVIQTMLNQPKSAVPPPAVTSTSSGDATTATVAPTVTYVQTVPTTTYYYAQPYYYPSYGYYGWYPGVSLSFGWGGRWGGGWHGGGGGWHGHR